MWSDLGRAAGREEVGSPQHPKETGPVPLHPSVLIQAGQVELTPVRPQASILTLPGAAPPKWPKINSVWRMEMSLWPTGESFSEIGFKLHYTSNFMGT